MDTTPCNYAESRIRFISRRNSDLTKRFPALRAIDPRADYAIIDGEIRAIDEDWVPCFDELRKSRRSCAVVFYAFDLLTLNGEDQAPKRVCREFTLRYRKLQFFGGKLGWVRGFNSSRGSQTLLINRIVNWHNPCKKIRRKLNTVIFLSR